MIEILTSAEFWKFAIPLLGGVAAWFANEHQKRSLEQYQKKEAQYQELLGSLKGFYIGVGSPQENANFLVQLNKSWLYCPDDVIENAYTFLETVHTDTKSTQEQKQEAMGNLVASIRKDLLSRKYVKATKLSGKDFRHYQATGI